MGSSDLDLLLNRECPRIFEAKKLICLQRSGRQAVWVKGGGGEPLPNTLVMKRMIEVVMLSMRLLLQRVHATTTNSRTHRHELILNLHREVPTSSIG